MFWGVIIKPDKRYEQTVEDPFHISKACIEPTTGKGNITSVYVECNDEEFIVCNLNDKILNETLDLNFNAGDKIVFKTSGTGIVHLTGYNIQDPGEEPLGFGDEDDYSSEDEAAEVEEIPALVNGKKRKAGASGDEATPATKKRNERKAAIEMAKKIANTIKKADNDDDESDDEDYEDVEGEGEDEEGEEEEDSSDEEETEADDTLDESGVIRRGLSILESTMEGDTTVGDSTLDTSEIDTSAMDTSAMDTSAADTPAKPIKPIPVKAEKAKTPAKAEKAKTPAKAEKAEKAKTPAKAEKAEKEAGPVKPEKVEKEEPVTEAKDDAPVKPEEVKKEEPAKKVNDKENETTNKPAEETAELTKSQKKKKKKKEGKGEDSPVKPVAETKTEEVVETKTETKTPKKEATEAKKTPAKTPKRTLKGGIQLEDLKVGNGPEATGKKMIGMYYEGKLKSNNKVFDSCLKGKPFKFRLGAGEVIKGWDVGVEGMKVGGKRRLTIPPQMAYGAKGAPPDIPANSHLVFEVECKAVN